MKLRVVAVAVLALAAGCPKKNSAPPAPAAGDAGGGAGTASGTSMPAAPRFAAAPVPLVLTGDSVGDVVPAQLDWDRPVYTRAELEEALDDGDADDVQEVRARGRIVVTVDDILLQSFDPERGALPLRAPGLEGLDIDPPLAFSDRPLLTRGSLPGLGSVRLHEGYLSGTLAVDAAGAEALLASHRADSLVVQYLVELGPMTTAPDENGDDVEILRATLHGVRIAQLAARVVYLEGRPAPTPPPQP